MAERSMNKAAMVISDRGLKLLVENADGSGFPIRPGTVLGLDIGIASCGWGLLYLPDGKPEARELIGLGTWGFDPPEVPKTRASKVAERRVFRGQRKRLRRRRYRMRDIRKLLHAHGLLISAQPRVYTKGEVKPCPDPWELRALGLERLLTGEEFAVCLLHIAKHRGYRSNSKSEGAANAPAEDKRALVGMEAIKGKYLLWGTVGKMFARAPEFANKKRNHPGEYSHTVFRTLHEEEVKKLFARQRDLGSKFADVDMQESYTKTAFDQLPIQDSEELLGNCPFEPVEKRASSLSYSFERFRFLSKLVHTRIHDGSRSGRPLTREELSNAVNKFGRSSKSMSWKKLKTLIGIGRDAKFIGVGEKDEGKDFARASKGCAYGSNTLYGVIGDGAWSQLVNTPEKLDAIAHVLTFRDDVNRIRGGLEALELEPLVFEALMVGVKTGAFARFSKAGHISTMAARKIIPGLVRGEVYSEACASVGYDHSQERPAKLEAMTNPVARRAVRETLKQVNALVRHFGFRPEMIHVELGRDVGKGSKERGEIEKGIKRRTGERADAREQFCKDTGKSDCSGGELQRYELWREQMFNCMFCYPQKKIHVLDLCGKHDERNVDIEHILPRSRSHDNSWNNKVLACVECNQNKGNKTPWEWFGDSDPERWLEFEVRAKGLRAEGKIKGYKIRNLLMRDFGERTEDFLSRNLNDMRYAAKVVLGELKSLYSEDERRHVDDEEKGRNRVLARPGQITAALRHSWGLNRFKYIEGEDGKDKRIEDERHHAIDAIVLAACSQSRLQQLTESIKAQRAGGRSVRNVKDFPPPWPSFADDVEAARKTAPVARSENRRARGAGHAATIRQIRVEDERRIAYERVAIDKLTLPALSRIKDPDRNSDTIDALEKWIEKGKQQDNLPRRNNGFLIKRVTLRSETNPLTQRAGFEAQKGLVDNAEMVRVDVFEKDGKFYLVPIYTHQVADKAGWPEPPNRAIVATSRPESEWEFIDETYSFKFSMYPYSWIETVTRKGEALGGYYRGTDRSTGSITLSHEHSRLKTNRVGCRLLLTFKKFQIDRLGHKHEIKQETRTWRGKACT